MKYYNSQSRFVFRIVSYGIMIFKRIKRKKIHVKTTLIYFKTDMKIHQILWQKETNFENVYIKLGGG